MTVDTFDFDSLDPVYHEHDDNYDAGIHADHCSVCGKGLTHQAAHGKAWQVHLDAHGELWPIGTDLPDTAEDMGWWLVGPECARRIPARYRERTKPAEPQPTPTGFCVIGTTAYNDGERVGTIVKDGFWFVQLDDGELVAGSRTKRDLRAAWSMHLQRVEREARQAAARAERLGR